MDCNWADGQVGRWEDLRFQISDFKARGQRFASRSPPEIIRREVEYPDVVLEKRPL
jgi:hypothetical protein